VKVGTGVVLFTLTVAVLSKEIKKLITSVKERKEEWKLSEETMEYYRNEWRKEENLRKLEERKWV